MSSGPQRWPQMRSYVHKVMLRSRSHVYRTLNILHRTLNILHVRDNDRVHARQPTGTPELPSQVGDAQRNRWRSPAGREREAVRDVAGRSANDAVRRRSGRRDGRRHRGDQSAPNGAATAPNGGTQRSPAEPERNPSDRRATARRRRETPYRAGPAGVTDHAGSRRAERRDLPISGMLSERGTRSCLRLGLGMTPENQPKSTAVQ